MSPLWPYHPVLIFLDFYLLLGLSYTKLPINHMVLQAERKIPREAGKRKEKKEIKKNSNTWIGQ